MSLLSPDQSVVIRAERRAADEPAAAVSGAHNVTMGDERVQSGAPDTEDVARLSDADE